MAIDRTIRAEVEAVVTGDPSAIRETANDIDKLGDDAGVTERRLEELEQQVEELSQALRRANRDLDDFRRTGRGLEDVKRSLDQVRNAVAGVGAIFGIDSFIDSFRDSISTAFGAIIDRSIKSSEAIRKVEAAIKAAGGTSSLSAPEVQKIATSLAEVTAVSDELLLEMEAVLLTFRNLGADVFPRASQTTVDVATALGTDLTEAAKLVGQALNDPIRGLDLLASKGIELNQTQRDTAIAAVLAGDRLQAQGVILEALESRFAGAARAAREELGGALEAAKNTLDDLLQKIGEGGLSAALTEVSDQVTESGSALGEAAKTFGAFLGTLLLGFSAFVKGTKAQFTALVTLGEEIGIKLEGVRGLVLRGISSVAGAFGLDEIAERTRQKADSLLAAVAAFQERVRQETEASNKALAAGIGRDLGAIADLWRETGEAAAESAEGTRQGAEALSEVTTPAQKLSEILGALEAKLRDLEKVKLIEEKEKIQQLLDGYKKLGAEAPPELRKLAEALNVVDSETEALLDRQKEKVKEFVAEIKAAMGGLSEDQVRDAQAIREAWEQIDPTELRNRFAALGEAARAELRQRFEEDAAAIRASGGAVTQDLVVLGQQIGALVTAYDPVSAPAASAAEAIRAQAAAAREAVEPTAAAAKSAADLADRIGKVTVEATSAGITIKQASDQASEAATGFGAAAEEVGKGSKALDEQTKAAGDVTQKLGETSAVTKDVASSQDTMAQSTGKTAEKIANLRSELEELSNLQINPDFSQLESDLLRLKALATETAREVAAINAAAEG